MQEYVFGVPVIFFYLKFVKLTTCLEIKLGQCSVLLLSFQMGFAFYPVLLI